MTAAAIRLSATLIVRAPFNLYTAFTSPGSILSSQVPDARAHAHDAASRLDVFFDALCALFLRAADRGFICARFRPLFAR